MERVGRWVGEHVLGQVGAALVDRAPVAVRLHLPTAAAELATRPV